MSSGRSLGGPGFKEMTVPARFHPALPFSPPSKPPRRRPRKPPADRWRSAGAASGALYDADRLDEGDEAIEQFGALVPTGGNALLAETVEDTTGPLDTFVSEMGGTIVRRPLDEVAAELAAQQAAADEADKAARKAIREQKKQEHKETYHQRVDALKAKFRKQ